MEVREFSLAFVVPFFMERLSGYTLWAMVTNTRTVRKKDPEPGQQIARSRIRIDWRVVLIFLVGCYVLAVPTFLSAMTSYQARGQPFFPVDNGSSYLSVENIVIPDFLVEGGEQIGLSRRYPLYNTSDPQLYATLLECEFGPISTEAASVLTSGVDDEVRKTQVAKIWDDDWGLYRSTYSIAYSNAPEYLSKYSNLGNLETKKVLESEAAFKKTRDQLPLRQNITDTRTPPMWSFTLWPRNATWGETSYFTPRERCMNSTIVVRNTTYGLDAPLYLGSNHDSQGNIDINTLFALDTHSAPRVGSDLAERGICLPSKEYVWGFSSLMLFTFCMLSVAVLLLLIILHYDAYFNSMADRYKLQISPYRDVLNLAEELRAHYGEAEVVSMPARELDKAMQKDPATIGLETATLHKTRAARWKQSSEKPRMPTWKRLRRKPEAADSTRSDAEASLMSIGLDAHGPDFEMGKLPTKAVTKPSD
jgi:hypothetical protein